MSAEEVTLTTQEVEIAKQYDLTSKIIPFLDRQLVFALIESLKPIYGDAAVDALLYDLVKDTYMISFIKDRYKLLHPDQEFPKELLEQEEFVNKEVARLSESTSKTLEILTQARVNLTQDKVSNREYLSKNHGINDEKILELYQFGKLQYNRGIYATASDLFQNFKLLTVDEELIPSATWGKAAADIINLDFVKALEELSKLRESIDTRNYTGGSLTQLHQRTWIIHWSLFPYFSLDNGLEQLTDLFLSSSYLSTIQASCPWILRYLIAAVVSHGASSGKSSFQRKLRDLIKAVQQEEYEYQDPFTEFIKAVYMDFDFKKANLKLKECDVLIKCDFLLRESVFNFITNAKKLMAQVYCKIHYKVDINELKDTLELSSVEEAESCIADLLYVAPAPEASVDVEAETEAETGAEAEVEGETEEKSDAVTEEAEAEQTAEPLAESPLILTTDTSIKTLKKSNEPNPDATYQQIIDKIKSLNYKSNQVLNSVIPKQD